MTPDAATPPRPSAPPPIRLPVAVAVVLALACAAFVLRAALAVPYNMDEFVHYHPIACARFPLAVHNDFRNGCRGDLDLTIAGATLPLRAYRYIGITSSLLYLPLYLAWPAPLGARLAGAVPLLLTALGIARLTGLPAALAGLACLLPLGFLFVVDTGPVGLGCAIAVWGAVGVRWLLGDDGPARRRIAVSAGLGALLFLGVEQKPVFLLVLPGVALVGLGLAWNGIRARHGVVRLAALAPAIAMLGVACAILFSARTRDGSSYARALSAAGRTIPLLSFREQFDHFVDDHLASYFLNLTTFGHRLYGWNVGLEPGWTILYAAVLLSLAAAAAIRPRRRGGADTVRRAEAVPGRDPAAALGLPEHPGRGLVPPGLMLAAALLTLFLVNRSALAWGGHHVVFVWLWLIAAACGCAATAWRRGRARLVGVLFALLFVAQWGALEALSRQRPAAVSSPEISAIHAAIDADPALGEGGVVVSLDWGSYYEKSLYGPRDQLVVFVEPLRDPREAERLVGLARRLGRRLVVVRRRDSKSDFELLRALAPTLARRPVDGVRDDGDWQLWVEG